MPDLHWTLPIKRWSAWSVPRTGTEAVQGAIASPDVGYVEPMLRRRISSLGKMGLKVAHDCVASTGEVRLVFASRHGELRRTTEILQDLVHGQPVSPTAFSLSVLNAMAGVFGIVRHDRSATIAVSAGMETLSYGLLEAYAQFAANPAEPVLFVYAHEARDPIYGPLDECGAAPLALAILLEEGATQWLHCDASTAAALPGTALSAVSQADALLHCLASGAASCWSSAESDAGGVGVGGNRCGDVGGNIRGNTGGNTGNTGNTLWQWSQHASAA
jgi:hypothetical protein